MAVSRQGQRSPMAQIIYNLPGFAWKTHDDLSQGVPYRKLSRFRLSETFLIQITENSSLEEMMHVVFATQLISSALNVACLVALSPVSRFKMFRRIFQGQLLKWRS
jgi:hypothetical protein